MFVFGKTRFLLKSYMFVIGKLGRNHFFFPATEKLYWFHRWHAKG